MKAIQTYLVEDSKVIRDNLIAALEELTAVTVVGCAEDELTAVQWLTASSNAVDLVIVDIFLKSGSGLGVLRAMEHAVPPLNMVVLSNNATPEMRHKCTELGARQIFDKSNEFDALIVYCDRIANGDA